MNLCIDIGNTRLKYLIFNQDKEVEYYTSDEFDLKLLKLNQNAHESLIIEVKND